VSLKNLLTSNLLNNIYALSVSLAAKIFELLSYYLKVRSKALSGIDRLSCHLEALPMALGGIAVLHSADFLQKPKPNQYLIRSSKRVSHKLDLVFALFYIRLIDPNRLMNIPQPPKVLSVLSRVSHVPAQTIDFTDVDSHAIELIREPVSNNHTRLLRNPSNSPQFL
jgi:hypothetical protein